MSNSQAPSSVLTPPLKLLQVDDRISQETKDMMSTLPQEKCWFSPSSYQYQGFWHIPIRLQGTLAFQKHFQARDTDIFIATPPKSGTTWLKATIFALINREKYPVAAELLKDHPLFHKHPHELVGLIEELYSDYNNVPDFSSTSPPRLFNTHLPIVSMPESVKETKCRIVYMCREPKDTFISLWHFINKIRPQDPLPLEEALGRFCRGASHCGPLWDHVLGYWKASLENPGKVLFLKYEEMKKDPSRITKRIAEYLDCPFSLEEEETGVVEDVVELCSFGNLSNLEVNKKGELPITGLGRNMYFRKGEVGRWADELKPDMAMCIDRITEQKISGTGFKF